ISRAVTLAAASGAAVAAAPAPEVSAGEAVFTPAVIETEPTNRQEVAPEVSSKSAESAELVTAAPVLTSSPAGVELAQEAAQSPFPTLILSAGIEPSQSWLARNKYIVGALLVVGASVAAILLLRWH